jgi:hypothetical protein
MTQPELIAYMEARIDVTGRRLTTGVRHRQVETAIINELFARPMIKTKKLVIPSAQVLTLNSSPVAFGLTVPAGYYVRPISADLRCVFNSVAYTGATDIVISYVGAPDFIMGVDDGLNFTVSRMLHFGFAMGTATPTNSTILDGVDLQVEVVGGSISAGDSDITIYLTYAEIEL